MQLTALRWLRFRALCWTFVALGPLAIHALAFTDPPATDSWALVGGHIHSMSDAGIIDGDILVEAGKIKAVGAGIEIPTSATRIDVKGMVVTPGLIDARSTLWLTERARGEGAADAGLDALDGVDVTSDDWREVATQGVTLVYVQPSASGNLGGRGAVLRVAPAADPDELVIRKEAAVQAALGVGNAGTSRERFAQFERLKRALEDAKGYAEAWEKFQKSQQKQPETKPEEKVKEGTADEPEKGPPESRGPGRGQRRGPRGGSAQNPPERSGSAPGRRGSASSSSRPPERDAAKDLLVRVLRREIPLRLEVHRADDLKRALQLADEYKFRLILDGVSTIGSAQEAWNASGWPVVLGPVVPDANPPAYLRGRSPMWLHDVTAGGRKWSLGTFQNSGRGSRWLRIEAAAAIAQGIPREKVLRAVTADAAELLGVADQVGRIVPGLQADLAVFAGDPLDPASPVRMVASRGLITYSTEVKGSTGPELVPPATLQLPSVLPDHFALKTQRLLTDGAFNPGLVVIGDGRIVSVGAAGTTTDVPTFDLGDAVLSTGMVCPCTSIDDAWTKESTDADSGQLRAADGFDPDARAVKGLILSGVTVVGLVPNSSQVIAGQAACVRLGAKSPVVLESSAVKIVLSSAARDAQRYPVSLMGQVELLNAALSGRTSETAYFLPPIVAEELAAERARQMRELKEKRVPALIEVQTAPEIEAALKLVEAYQLRAALVWNGDADLDPYVPTMKRLAVGLIARPPAAADYDLYTDRLRGAQAAGIPLAFGPGQGESLRVAAALLAGRGLARDAARRMLFETAAEVAALPMTVARIQAGGPADLVIWSGDPLDLSARPSVVLIDGKRQDGP